MILETLETEEASPLCMDNPLDRQELAAILTRKFCNKEFKLTKGDHCFKCNKKIMHSYFINGIDPNCWECYVGARAEQEHHDAKAKHHRKTS